MFAYYIKIKHCFSVNEFQSLKKEKEIEKKKELFPKGYKLMQRVIELYYIDCKVSNFYILH